MRKILLASVLSLCVSGCVAYPAPVAQPIAVQPQPYYAPPPGGVTYAAPPPVVTYVAPQPVYAEPAIAGSIFIGGGGHRGRW